MIFFACRVSGASEFMHGYHSKWYSGQKFTKSDASLLEEGFLRIVNAPFAEQSVIKAAEQFHIATFQPKFLHMKKPSPKILSFRLLSVLAMVFDFNILSVYITQELHLIWGQIQYLNTETFCMDTGGSVRAAWAAKFKGLPGDSGAYHSKWYQG